MRHSIDQIKNAPIDAEKSADSGSGLKKYISRPNGELRNIRVDKKKWAKKTSVSPNSGCARIPQSGGGRRPALGPALGPARFGGWLSPRASPIRGVAQPDLAGGSDRLGVWLSPIWPVAGRVAGGSATHQIGLKPPLTGQCSYQNVGFHVLLDA